MRGGSATVRALAARTLSWPVCGCVHSRVRTAGVRVDRFFAQKTLHSSQLYQFLAHDV